MYSIGVDLGGTNIAVGIVDENYRIIKKSSCPTLADRAAEEIIRDMAALCKRLCEEVGTDILSVGGVGIEPPPFGFGVGSGAVLAAESILPVWAA